MKRSKMLFSSMFASFLAIAAFSGVMTAKNTQHVEKAEAASTACDVYFKAYWNGANITEVKVHYWNGGNFWMSMTEVYKDNGVPVYKYTIPAGNNEFQYQTYTSNWGSGEWHTSVNKTVSKNLLCSPAEGWSGSNFTLNTGTAYPYAINYYGNGSTSGSMTNSVAYGNVQWGLAENKFARTGYTFNGWNTKSDGSGIAYSDKALLPTKTNTNAIDLYAQWIKYYPTGRYIVGSFCGWSIEGAVYMGATSQYSATNVPLSFGDEFKIANYNGKALESYYGYSSSVGGGLFCFSQVTTADESYDNFKCWATGLYNFYFRDVEYESGKKSSVEISGTKWNAQQLAAKLMSYGEYVGHCGDEDRFPLCKGKFLAMDPSEKTTFEGYASSSETQFKNAYLRYTSWASALGQKPFEEGSVNSAYLNLIFGGQSSSNTTIIVVVVVGVATLAVGGYFLLRKKKEN